MPRVMKLRCESPCLPEWGVYDSKFEPHIIEKNMEKYFRNFGKVSQSLNSRENDLCKNLILHLIFVFFFTLEIKPAIVKYVKLEKSKRQTSFLILRVFPWCARPNKKGLGCQNIKD